jgi:HEAT repeat protein
MLPRLRRVLLGVAIGAMLFAAALWVLTQTLGERDTLYAGKPSEFWVMQMTNSNSSVSNTARVMIESQIIPQLVNQMLTDTNDSHLRMALIEWLNGLPLVNIIYTPADGRRVRATRSIGELGACARNTIPILVKAFKGTDPIVRAPAARALGQIHGDPESILPLLIGAIDDPQDDVPEAAVTGLGYFGPEAKMALPKLKPLLNVPDKDMRYAASVAIGRIALETNAPLP